MLTQIGNYTITIVEYIERQKCRIFGHYYKYIPKPDILSNKRECIRCGHRQIRTFFRVPEEHWSDDPVQKFINTKIP